MIRTPKKSLDPSPTLDVLLAKTVRFGSPEANARWWNLAELFAISNGSSVDPDAFLALVSGWSLDRSRRLFEPGAGPIELVFRADRSVSALWASLDPESRTIVEECHREAVAYSLERVEWVECAYQEPLYRRFLPTPADILGACFHHRPPKPFR